ncbi:MAG: DMT family transporter [Planctomycetes bacterium]|nr:DMT family transporter [Planctomycetota bacterium]
MDALRGTAKSMRTRATLALFAVSVIWGFTFLWMKEAVVAAERIAGPGRELATSAAFLAVRFTLAAVILALCAPAARRGAFAGDALAAVWRGGAWLAFLLVAGFVLQMVGLAEVSPAVSAFLTSLYVLFLVVLAACVHRRLPRAAFALGALLATAGAALVRGRPELTEWRTGEVLTVLASLAFAVHILATDRVTKRVPAMPVTLSMFVCVAAGGAALLGFEGLCGRGLSPKLLLELTIDRQFLAPLLLTTVLGTVVALSFMNLYQREVDPVRAAILYALEPIWAAIVGIAAGADAFTPWLAVGGALLLAGNLVAEFLGTPRGETAPREIAG